MCKKQKIFGIVGWQNSGKTTLITALIKHMKQLGLSVSTVKQTHHDFEIDHEGKDSYEHRHAGATEVIIASQHRWAIIHENTDDTKSVDIDMLLEKMEAVDIVLIEGVKQGRHPKISVHRPENKKAVLKDEAKNIVAFACPHPLQTGYEYNHPTLNLNNPSEVVDFILSYEGI